MDPVNESGQNAVGYCRACGKGLTADLVYNYQGTIYCQEHLPQMASQSTAQNPYTAPPPAASASASQSTSGSYTSSSAYNPAASSISPGLAFLLGLIPGVGSIYNGQYAKGFVHVLIAGLLFSLSGHEAGAMEPMFRTFSFVWIIYMAFEAFHTAKKRMSGEPVDEFSSIFPHSDVGSFPVLPVLLISLGVIFLLNNMGILYLRQLMPYAGPVFLIGLGCYMLYGRLRANSRPVPEATHERS